MIKLNVDPIVLTALQAAFPKPKLSAEKALNKDKRILAAHFEHAMLNGFAMQTTKGIAHSVSLHELNNKGPAIGSNKNTCSTLAPKYGVTLKLKLLLEANEEVATQEPVTLGWIEIEPVYNSPPKAALNAKVSGVVFTPLPSVD